jgi:hypothetical protein
VSVTHELPCNSPSCQLHHPERNKVPLVSLAAEWRRLSDAKRPSAAGRARREVLADQAARRVWGRIPVSDRPDLLLDAFFKEVK